MKKNYVLRSLLAILMLSVGLVGYAQTTVVMSTFTATSADMDNVISYTTAKGGGTSNPAINNGVIRLYQNSAGTGGGTITISAKDGYVINSVEIGSSMKTSIAYTVGSSTTKSTTTSLDANATYTASDIDDSSITFYCMGNSSSTRLYVNYLKVTYSLQSGSVLSADVDALTFNVAPGAISEAQTIELTANNLTADVTYKCDNAAFDVTDNGDYTYDVVFTAPNAETTVEGTLTFTSGDLLATVALTGVASNSVHDVLNRAFTGVTNGSSTYTDWSGDALSGAVYKGQSAGGNNAIQLRTTNSNSGIVTTTSGGKVKSVTVTWNSNTSNKRVLQVYGKNTSYSAASDLFSSSTQGTLLGEIAYSATPNTLSISGDYEYIGLRSKDGAMYLTEIVIEWAAATSESDEVKAPTFSPIGGAVWAGTEVELTCATDGATIKYSTDGENYTDYTQAIVIKEAMTISAYAIKDGKESKVVSAEFTLKPEYENIAAFVEAASADEAKISGTVTVTYQYQNRLFVTDATGSLLIYGVSGDYTNGQTLTGVRGAYDLYNGLPEMKNATLPEAVDGEAVEPVVMTIAEVKALEAKDFSRYVKVEGATVTMGSGKNATITVGTDEIALYNSFGITITEGENLDVVAVVNIYNNSTMQLYPIAITEGEETSYTENIESEKKYYLDLNDVWSAEDGWFAAYFVNKNTEAETWVRGEYSEEGDSKGVMFYLSQYNVPATAPARAKAEAPLYTHIVFAQMNKDVDATVYENMKWENVEKQTEFVTYDGSVVKDNNGNEYMIYQLQDEGGAWLTGTDLPTAIEGVAADAVDGYVVFDLNGYLVMQTRNADNLRNLEKGFYIINGKKVVLTR